MTKVALQLLDNANASQAAKGEVARGILERTVNKDAFQKAVLAASFLDVRFEKPSGEIVAGLSNELVLRLILYGTERGSNANDSIDLQVRLYSILFSSAIGYTSDGIIHTRDKFFEHAEPVEVAGHWMHEWMHAAGFLHDFRRTSRREQSVPYLVGELVTQFGLE